MKRREIFANVDDDEYVPFREVLPDDPDPEWVDELILRAAAVCRHHKKWSWNDISLLENHLAKRGTK